MAKNEIEVWKSHPDIVGIEVSTLGNVRTLDRVISNEKMTRFIKGRVLKQSVNGRGYMQLNVKVDGKFIAKSVHRLVAQTFLSNPNNLPMVNHRDCNRTNNNVENLEFCTASYNNQYREKFGISQTEAAGHPLFAINLSTLEVLHFRSQSEASRLLGVNRKNINNTIKGRQNRAGGFWFVNEDEKAADAIKRKLHTLQSQSLGL